MGNKTAVKDRKPEAAPAVQAAECRHHWLIESPQGALSKGRCKLCGEEREFRNSASDYIWDDDSSSGRCGSWGGVRPTAKRVDDDEMTATPDSDRGEVALVL